MTGSRRTDDTSQQVAERRVSGRESRGGVGPAFRRSSSGIEFGNKKHSIAGTLESEVIPNLLRAHGIPCRTEPPRAKAASSVAAADVSLFVRSLVEGDEEWSTAIVTTALDRGASVDDIYLGLFAPAAEMLGRMWEADSCDFVDVTLGVSRMSQFVHRMAVTLNRDPLPQRAAHRILLMPVPGDDHTFGLLILERMLSCAGWSCTVRTPARIEELPDIVSHHWYDVIGISTASLVLLPKINLAIQALRKASANDRVTVVLGGNLAKTETDLAGRVGADFAVLDGREAIVQLRNAVRRSARS